MKSLQKTTAVIICTLLLWSCQDQIDSFLGDKYREPAIPPFTITQTLESNLLLTFSQSSLPQPGSSLPSVVNSITLNNLGSTPVNQLSLLIRIFKNGSNHIQQNLLLSRKFILEEPLQTGGKQTIFVDSIYRGGLTQADFEFNVLSLNDNASFASGLYNGQFRAYKDGAFNPGLVYMMVNYSGEVEIEMQADAWTTSRGVVFSSDSLFTGDGMQGNQRLDIRLSGSFRDITSSGLSTTLYPTNSTLYDSIQLYLNRQ